MERLRELEVEREDKRASVKEILATAAKGKRALTEDERARAATLTSDLEALEETIKAEEKVIDWNRDQAPAVNSWGDAPRTAEDDTPALALPPLPSRTRAKLAAMAGAAFAPRAGSASGPEDRRAHFAAVVRAAYGGDPFSPLLTPLAAAGNEAVGSEGGFAVRPDFASFIFSRAAEESVWMRIGARVETMTSDSKVFTALADDDESSDAEATLTAAWTGEGVTATPQLMKLRALELAAVKLMVLAACSNELHNDAPGYLPELEAALGRAIAKKLDRAIFSGTGAGMPLGIINSAATVTVSKEAAQVAGTIYWENVTKMWGRLAPGSHEKAYWVTHPSALPQLLMMTMKTKNVAGSENVGGGAHPGIFAVGGPTGYLMLGRPVVVTSRVKAVGTKGDLVLVDPTQLLVCVRSGITIDRSPDVYFTSDQLAVRAKFRGNAAPFWDKARTLAEGSDTVSPYVVIETR